jgi:hypothetical protein
MPLNDIGPRGYHQQQAVATLAFTPQFDRAAIVRRLLIDKVSASDIWRVTIQGREVAAFDIETTGNQQPLSGPYSGYSKTNDLFDIYNFVYPDQLIYPVPLGQTFTVTSDGGATANITIIYTEVASGEITQGMMNHPQGRRFVTLLTGYRAAAVTVLGENTLDTQIGPRWFPNIFVDGMLPPNWQFKVLAMFLEGGGRNTYSGSADHLANTTYFGVRKNGQILYTRDSLGGIPLMGQAAAAGSANTVVGTDETPNPPIQESDVFDWSNQDMPFVLGGGDGYLFRLNIAGDVTGGADFSKMRQVFLVDVTNPGV